MKKIDLMETGISLSRLFRLFFRNLWLIGITFVFGLGLAYGYTQSDLMDQGTYQSSGSVAYKVSTNATILNTVTEIVRSSAVAELAASALEAELITLDNGDAITPTLIRSTLTASTTTNSLRITITFTHPEEAIVVPIINAVIDATIFDGNTNYTVIANNLVLGEYASATTFDGPSSLLYLAIGALLGLMVGGAVGVLWDAFKGTIFSATDLKELGVSSRLLKVLVLRPLNLSLLKARFAALDQRQRDQKDVIEKSTTLQESLQNLQNNLESIRPNPSDPLMTFVSSAKPLTELPLFSYVFAQQSALRGVKTLLIEADLKATPLTKLLTSLQLLTDKKKAKDDFSVVSLSPNLDVVLGLPKAVPAPHLRSEAMKQFIEASKKTYGQIVFSSPALLPDQSALSVLPYTNAAILLTKAAVSNTTATIQAFNVLADQGVQAFEAVVYEPIVGLKLPTWLVNPLSLLQK